MTSDLSGPGRVAERIAVSRELAEVAPVLVAAANALATSFSHHGRLLVTGPARAVSDVHHVVVEHLHPVLVGKRALPAVALRPGPAAARDLALFARLHDALLVVCPDGADDDLRSVLAAARDRGLVSIALTTPHDVGGSELMADHVIMVATLDPLIAKEVMVTAYHVLWEVTHVLLDAPRPPAPCAEDVCITCGDVAVEATVVQLLAAGMAVVDAGAGEEVVSVALVDAGVGDRILVHAGEAIAIPARGRP